MTAKAKKPTKQDEYTPYSVWSQAITENINSLVDECLDRYKEDKKTSTEILKMLSKLQSVIEKKYKE